MIKRYWWIGLIAVVLILALLFLFHQNSIYKQAIKQYDEQIKQLQVQIQEKDAQIKALDEQISMLEKKATVYRKQRQSIRLPKDDNETVKRLKELGYDAKIR